MVVGHQSAKIKCTLYTSSNVSGHNSIANFRAGIVLLKIKDEVPSKLMFCSKLKLLDCFFP